MAESDLKTPTEHEAAGYETRDVSVPKSLVVGLLITLLIIGFAVVLNEYFISVTDEITFEQQLAPESAALRDLRASETEQLQTYGVIDTAAGVYRIPIDRAMDLVAGEAFRETVR